MAILQNEDLKIGQTITVLKWLPYQDFSYVGDELKVVAIQLPLVKVERNGNSTRLLTLDTRKVELMELNEAFINPKASEE